MMCSTVITSYNRINCVGKAIRSALEVLPVGEVIVVDDASKDNTLDYLKSEFSVELLMGRMRIVALPENIGVTGAKNAGYANARGEWVIFLDSDDQYCSGVGSLIEAQLASESTRPIVFFRCQDQHGKRVGQRHGEPVVLDLAIYLRHTSFGEALTAVNKKLVGAAQPYISDLRGYEGIGCCRLINQYGSALLSETIARVYFQDVGERLSVGKGFYQRMPLLAKGHWMMVKEFGSKMTVSMVSAYVVKVMAYYVTGSIFALFLKRKRGESGNAI